MAYQREYTDMLVWQFVQQGDSIRVVSLQPLGSLHLQTLGPQKNQSVATDDLRRIHTWWRAANYLSVGQIYLLDNPLLTVPLKTEHIKLRLLGDWGTTPGLNFVYAHLNRVISRCNLNVLTVIGPDHMSPAPIANAWLDGSYTELYPQVTRNADGMKRLFRQFSYPVGIPGHRAPDVPGSMHEGAELGSAFAQASDAAYGNPELVVACMVGDKEAGTVPLATAWHKDKALDPRTDGTVLPILHLADYKVGNPSMLARISRQELQSLLVGCGWRPYFVSGEEPWSMHAKMAQTLDRACDEIATIRGHARTSTQLTRPAWPMIVLASPKDWTGPDTVDGVPLEGTPPADQVPLADARTSPAHLLQLEEWMRSYGPNELFGSDGAPRPHLLELAPAGTRRMGLNLHANGGGRSA